MAWTREGGDALKGLKQGCGTTTVGREDVDRQNCLWLESVGEGVRSEITWIPEFLAQDLALTWRSEIIWIPQFLAQDLWFGKWHLDKRLPEEMKCSFQPVSGDSGY